MKMFVGRSSTQVHTCTSPLAFQFLSRGDAAEKQDFGKLRFRFVEIEIHVRTYVVDEAYYVRKYVSIFL